MSLIKCVECGKEISDQAESCPRCGYRCNLKQSDLMKDVFIHNKKTDDKFSFKTKLIIGIVSIIMMPSYRLAGFYCLIFAMLGTIASIGMCKWKSEFSAFIPAILFFISSIFFNGHVFTQILCIIFMVFEIIAGVKLHKEGNA